jgi:hypothetical protein
MEERAMKNSTIEKVNGFFTKNPIAKGEPSTPEEIANAENELKIKFDNDYIFFLLNYGGSMIKAKEIYGFHNSELMDDTNIIELTNSYRQNESENVDWVIIGTDYAGNPIGINREGKVLMQDYDFGELKILGDSFEDYILKSLEG